MDPLVGHQKSKSIIEFICDKNVNVLALNG